MCGANRSKRFLNSDGGLGFSLHGRSFKYVRRKWGKYLGRFFCVHLQTSHPFSFPNP